MDTNPIIEAGDDEDNELEIKLLMRIPVATARCVLMFRTEIVSRYEHLCLKRKSHGHPARGDPMTSYFGDRPTFPRCTKNHVLKCYSRTQI